MDIKYINEFTIDMDYMEQLGLHESDIELLDMQQDAMDKMLVSEVAAYLSRGISTEYIAALLDVPRATISEIEAELFLAQE